MSLWSSIKKNGFKYFTFKRIKAFLRSMVRKKTGITIEQDKVIAFSEAVVYKSIMCRSCVQAGACHHCGCPINELFAAMDVPCSTGNYPEIDLEKWNEFKKDFYFEIVRV